MRRAAEPGDFILSQTNAPLVSLCLSFLAEGRPAAVAGRDIGAGLATLVRKAGTGDVGELCRWVDDWSRKEAARLKRKGK